MSIDTVLDGGGLGYNLGVNSKQQVLARGITVPLIHEATLLGDAYSWTAVSANINATDTALLVANRSTSRYLVISKVIVRTDAATQVKIHVPVAASWTGTVVAGNNLNRKFADNAAAVAYADETANALVAARVIRTLYSPLTVNAQATTSQPVSADFGDSLLLGYDGAIAIDLVAETAEFEATVVGFFIDIP